MSSVSSQARSGAGAEPGGGRLLFFRQGSWMMAAITLSGVFMYAVHFPMVARVPEEEYGVFATLLQVLNLMLIPSIALQTVFAQQTAAALEDEARQRLRATVRAVMRLVFILWVAAAGLVYAVSGHLVEVLRIANPLALWVTVLTGLPMLWLPVLQGLLQGTLNFFWLGWAAVCNGLGRFGAVVVIVLVLGGYAAGAMTGALAGMMAALGVAFWQTRGLRQGEARGFEWRGWVERVIPLTLALGASQFMFAADMVVVQAFFESDTGLYAAAGILARGIVLFTGPLALVMFPKIVRSVARFERTDVLLQTLVATGVLASAAAVGCTLFPRLPFQILNRPEYFAIAPLIRWFAWCMVPLALANVLINNLLARSVFRAVPGLVAVAVGYGLVLVWVGSACQTGERLPDFLRVVRTLGGFNLLLLAVAGYATWRTRR